MAIEWQLSLEATIIRTTQTGSENSKESTRSFRLMSIRVKGVDDFNKLTLIDRIVEKRKKGTWVSEG